jgi:hypothetical protein
VANTLKVVTRESDRCPDYEPLVPFEHYDHGKDADPKLPNLLKDATVKDLTANIGAEVTGVQLSTLTKEGKDELALFVAQKKVVGMLGGARRFSVADHISSIPRPRFCEAPNPRGA